MGDMLSRCHLFRSRDGAHGSDYRSLSWLRAVGEFLEFPCDAAHERGADDRRA